MIHTSVRPENLPTLLSTLPDHVSCLSLDCFDTLLWRNVHAPADVFAELPVQGGAVDVRGSAERVARRNAYLLDRRLDVTLDEIHREMLPGSTAAARDTMVQAELDAEARHCYGFGPTRDLIVDAKRRGLKVIIVSDTYLREPLLRRLIGQAAGPEVVDMIDQIFCSCEFGMGKSTGLFTPVLEKLGLDPSAILHVGDNPVADQQVPSKLGINTVHLVQFDEVAQQRLRLEAAAAIMMEPNTGISVPTMQAHRPQVARRENKDPVYSFGHDVIGPVMYGFAVWLREEAEAIERATGKPVKLLFLLRDGYLPARTFSALFPEWADRAIQIEISRFTAIAGSFVDGKVIQSYLMDCLLGVPDLEIPARQMLFDAQERKRLSQSKDIGAFAEKIALPANTRKVLTRSAQFARRIFKHLRAQGVNDGDEIMLVDLGYNGSVQNAIEPVLRKGMKLNIAGRYLLLREMQRTSLDKKGLFDTRHYDAKTLQALFRDISVLEQFCTMAQGSVLDYEADGTPVRGPEGVKGAQSDFRDAAQAACMDFIAEAPGAVVRPAASADGDGWRRTAMGALARLLFLPTAEEAQMLEQFHHDVNLGTRFKLSMMNNEAAEDGLRRRGLSYMKDAMRLYLPGELQRHGLPINLSLFAVNRFGLDLRKSDFNVGALPLPVALLDGGGNTTTTIDAFPTAEGYYQAVIPIGACRYSVGLRLGLLFDYVQVEEVAFQPVREFMSSTSRERLIPAFPLVEDMKEVAPGLYHIASRQGFMLVPPPADEQQGNMLLTIVFRPILAKGADAQAYKAAA